MNVDHERETLDIYEARCALEGETITFRRMDTVDDEVILRITPDEALDLSRWIRRVLGV